MTIGIYILYFENNDRVYVGQSDNIESRHRKHYTDLKAGIHHSYKLQNAFNAHKLLPESLILEETDATSLDDKEIYWISEFDSFYNGFNCTLGGRSSGRLGEHINASISTETAILVVHLLANTGKRLSDISKEAHVPLDTVKNISNGRGWATLIGVCQEDYLKMRAKVGTRSKDTSTRIYSNVLSPQGTQYPINSITQFALEHKLDRGYLGQLLNGKISKYRGWKLV